MLVNIPQNPSRSPQEILVIPQPHPLPKKLLYEEYQGLLKDSLRSNKESLKSFEESLRSFENF
jgi:hypothetical protein